MPKENQEWEKRFDEKFAPNKIWVVPSDDNIKTIEEIKNFFNAELSKAREEEREKFQTIIKLRLKYCQEQNGLPYCKNCGLKETDAIKQIEK